VEEGEETHDAVEGAGGEGEEGHVRGDEFDVVVVVVAVAGAGAGMEALDFC